MSSIKKILKTTFFLLILVSSTFSQKGKFLLGKKTRAKENKSKYNAWYGGLGLNGYLGFLSEESNNTNQLTEKATPLFSFCPSVSLGRVMYIKETYFINHFDLGLKYSYIKTNEEFKTTSLSGNDASKTQSLKAHNLEGIFRFGNQFNFTQKFYTFNLLSLNLAYSIGSDNSNLIYLQSTLNKNKNHTFISMGYESGFGFAISERIILQTSINIPLATFFQTQKLPIGQEYINTIVNPFYLNFKVLYKILNQKYCPEVKNGKVPEKKTN